MQKKTRIDTMTTRHDGDRYGSKSGKKIFQPFPHPVGP